MLFPWRALAGWEARAIDTPHRRPFVITEVDTTGKRVRFKNSSGSQQWLYGRELEPIYEHARIHGSVRPVEVYEILGTRAYRSATYAAALVNELLRE